MVILEFILDREPIQFETVDQILGWLREERETWATLSRDLEGNFGGIALELLRAQVEFVEGLVTLASQAKQAGKTNATQLAAIRQRVERMRVRLPDRMLSVRVPEDAFIKKLFDKDSDAAAAGVFVRCGSAHIKSAQGPNPPSLRDAQQRFLIYLAEHLTFGTIIELEKTISGVSDRYRIDESMRDLTKHWENRSTKAYKGAQTWLRIFLFSVFAAGAIVFGAGFIAWDWISGRLGSVARVAGETPDPSRVLVTILPLLVIAAVPLIWYFKHLSRLFVDNLIDARDAEMRQTMALAYIAMNNNAELKPSPQERAIILGALFRPGASQPPDEGVPLPMFELLKQR